MTRAMMPGRSHLQSVPACSMAEDLTDDERAMLGQLVWHAETPKLHLVSCLAEPTPRPTPTADLRRARRREQVEAWTGRIAVLAAAAAAFSALLGRLSELAP